MRRIDELFLKYPFYGARRMGHHLHCEGVRTERSWAGRPMRLMGIAAIYVYPYLQRGLAIERPDHVW